MQFGAASNNNRLPLSIEIALILWGGSLGRGLDIAAICGLLSIVELAKQVLFLAKFAHLNMCEGILFKEKLLVLCKLLAITTKLRVVGKNDLSLSFQEL